MTTDTQISEREREILELVATGATNQQIAQQLHISVNTVKVHMRNIFGKIGVASRTEATVYAMRMGLVPNTVADDLVAAPVAPPLVGVEPTAAVLSAPPPPEEAPAVLSTLPAPEEAPAVLSAPPPPVPTPSVGVELIAAPAVPEEINAAAPIVVPAPVAPRRWGILLAGGLLALLALIAIVVVLTRQFAAAPPVTTPVAPVGNAGLPVPTERWRELAALPEGRAGFALADFSYGGRSYLYMIGGEAASGASAQTLRYDIGADTWVPRGSKPTAVSDVRAAVIGNKLFVPGGLLASGQPSAVLEIYDPVRDVWTTGTPLPAPRSGYGLAVVEGKLYLFGGWDGTSYRAEVLQYSPDTDSWAELTSMPTARAFADAVAIDRQVYVIGGENQQGVVGTNERYTPAEDGSGNPWNTQTSFGSPTTRTSAAATGGLIFLFSTDQSNQRVVVYNLDTDAWTEFDTPPASLQDARIQSVGNKLYILGGRDAQGLSTRAYQYQATYVVALPLQQR